MCWGLHVVLTFLAPGGGHQILDHQIGSHKNITQVISDIHDLSYSKENGSPLNRVTFKLIKQQINVNQFLDRDGAQSTKVCGT